MSFGRTQFAIPALSGTPVAVTDAGSIVPVLGLLKTTTKPTTKKTTTV